MDIKSAIKQPWVKYALIGVGGLGLLYIVSKNAGGGGGSAGVDPAAAQLAAHQADLAQQAASQASQNNFQMAYAAQQNAEKLAEAKLGAEASTQQQANAIQGQLSLAQLSTLAQTHIADTNAAAAIQQQQIAANAAAQQVAGTVALGQIQANATTHIAEIASNTTIATNHEANVTQQYIANMQAQTAQSQILAAANVATVQSNNNANVAITQSNNTANVGIAQANANRDIYTNASNNATSASNTSSWLGAAASIAAMFF